MVHQKFAEPGTTTVPGSSGLKAGFGPSTPASLISPRGGGVFESARGHQRNIEPGTVTVPGSFGLRHAVVFAASDKESARLLGEQAGACERICLRRKP